MMKGEKRENRIPWLTMETALYLLLVVVAAGMRLYGLGERPLQEEEAGQAMAAWRFYRGEAQGLTVGYSPLLFHGNALLFALFGANDYIARLIPAIFGILLVGLPYFLRRRLGRMGALVASFLLVFSPSFLLFSRSLDPEVIVAACSLALLIGLFGYLDEKKGAYLRLAAAALAIALSAGPSAYTTLLIFGGFLAFRLDRSGSIAAAWREARGNKALLRDCAAIFALLFLSLSTGLLANFRGVQASIDLAATWLTRFRPQPNGQPWHYYLQLLLSYEGLALVLGLSGASYFLLRRDLFSSFLLYWFAASMVLNSIAGGKSPAFVLQTLLPLVLLAGKRIGCLLEGIRKAASRLEGAFLSLSLPIMVYVMLQLGAYASFGQAIYLKAALGAVAVLIGFYALFWAWLGRRRTLRIEGLALSFVLASLMVHVSFNLNYRHDIEPREPLVGVATSPDVVEMVRTIENISSAREGDKHSIAIAVDESLKPTLAWYLRDFEKVGFSSAIGPHAPIIIVPAEGDQPPLGGYIGQRFRLRSLWGLEGLRGASLVHWLFYREATTPVRYDEVILWMRAE